MMPDLPISLLPYVGNTGYTDSDLLVFVNYIEPTGTTSNTTLLQHKEWILSGLTDYFTTGFTYSANTFNIYDNSGNTFSATIDEMTGLTINGNLTVTGDTIANGLTANTISAATYLNLPGEVKKIVLRKVDLGSKAVLGNLDIPGLVAQLSQILDKREIFDILDKSSYNGVKVDYYFSFNDPSDFIRKKAVYTTQTVGVDYDSQLAFSGISNFIYNNSISSYVNFYVEVYISSDINYFAPTQIKLVNPLYSSLNPNKYSYTKSYTGEHEFIRNNNQFFISPYNKDVNTIYSDFLRAEIISYYSATTSQDIPKKISDIVANPNFYGPLSANSNTVINVAAWDYNVKNVVKNSVFVEPISNFYSKFKIPVNLYGFYNVNQFKLNNFYGDRMYDIGGSSPLIFSANANTNVYSSNTVAQFIDTYRIYPKGNYGYIFANSSPENETNLNNLNYSVGSNRGLKYISKDMLRTDWGSYLQVLPGFNETYALKLDFSGSPTSAETNQFLYDVFNNYAIVNDYSVKKNNQFWNNIITHSTDDLYSGISQGKQIIVTASTIDIIAGGTFSHYNNINQNYISALSGDGSINTLYNFGKGFNNGLSRGLNGSVYDIINLPNGKTIVAGGFSTFLDINWLSNRNSIIRLNSDGTLDTTFLNGSGYGFDDIVRTIAIQSDGKIICGGAFTQFTDGTGTYNCNFIARLNSNGTFDSTFNNGGSGFDNEVFSLAVQTDDKIVVGGGFTEYVESGGSFFTNYIMRLNVNGTFDSSFLGDGNGGFDLGVLTVQIQPDGKILCGGGMFLYTDSLGSYDIQRIARLNTDGTFDTTFQYGAGIGFDSTVFCISIQSNGKILVGGDFIEYNDNILGTNNMFYIARLDSNGTFDTTFNSGGTGFNNPIFSLAIQSDGKILCGGDFNQYEDLNGFHLNYRLARLNSNGTFDESFNLDYGPSDRVSSISIRSDEKILIGGEFDQYTDETDTYEQMRITRLTKDGYYDFGNGFLGGIVQDIAVQSDGKIIAVGTLLNYFRDDNGTYAISGIVRINTNGTYDNTFNNGGSSFTGPTTPDVFSVLIQSDGKILCGGRFNGYEDFSGGYSLQNILRLNSDGTFDTSFNNGGTGVLVYNDWVRSMAIQSDGKIICVGRFYSYEDANGVYNMNRIMRLNSDGTFDTTFLYGSTYGLGNEAITVAIQSDGKILCGGYFGTYTDNSGIFFRSLMLRLNSDGTYDTSFDGGGGNGFFGSNVNTVKIDSNDKILVGGDFFQYQDSGGTNSIGNILRLNSNGTFDSTFNNGGSGFNNDVFEIKIQSDGKILVGGSFQQFNDINSSYIISSILRLNTDGTFDTTFNTGGEGFINTYNNKGGSNRVNSIELKQINFTAETTPDLYMLIQSNDEKMLELSQNPEFTYTSTTISSFKIYAGGVFSTYEDVNSNYLSTDIASLNSGGTYNTSFNSGGTGFNDVVYSTSLQSDGKLLCGGNFDTYVDNISSHYKDKIARLNSDGTLDTTFNNGGSGFDNIVRAISIQSDGKIICGGSFGTYIDTTGTYSMSFVSRLNSDGTFDTTFNSGGIGFNSAVFAIAIQNDGKILCGGEFGSYEDSGGTYTNYGIIRLNTDGTYDTTFNSGGTGFNGVEFIQIRAIKIQDDGKIVVGGYFNEYDDGSSHSMQYIIRLNSDGTFDSSFNNGGLGFSDIVYSLEIQQDGKILVGGSFIEYTDSGGTYSMNYIARLNSDGTFDTTFNSGGTGFNNTVYTTALQSDGKLLCGGVFDSYTDSGVTYGMNYIARLNSDGTFDTTFNNGGIGFDANVFSISILNEEPTIVTNTISIDAIYKGHSFRPLIYPLNLTQLLLEVPESFFYDGSTLQQSINSNNNLFEYVGNDIINKKLCLILKYTKLNKYDLVQQDLIITERRNGGNAIKTLMIQNIEDSIRTSISNSKAKELRPGSLEVYFGFLDINTNKLSYIPNYKLIIVKYGDNEIFKIVKDSLDLNMGIL